MTNWTLDPVFAICSFCDFEQACATEDEATRRKQQHEHLRHNQPLPEQELSGHDWQTQAINAVRQVAARGQDFRIYDALAEFGLQSPPNAKTALGRFASLIHDLRIAHPVGYTQSERKATKRSAVAVWSRRPDRCTDGRCRGVSGAA